MLLSSGVTTNQVCGAIASAMLADLRTNNFSFQGFPEIQVAYTDKAFAVTLRIVEAVGGPFSLDEKVGSAEAKRFEKGEAVSEAFAKTIQGWVVALELAAD
jgi:hypothetical protein